MDGQDIGQEMDPEWMTLQTTTKTKDGGTGRMTSYWDHSTKPSTFVVKDDEGKEIYRGPFDKGYELLMNKKEQQ